LLKLIGEDLDRKIFPTVHDGGLVWPAQAAVFSNQPAEESQDGRQPTPQTRRSAQAAGTPGAAQGRESEPPAPTAGNGWPAGATAPLARLDHGLNGGLQALLAAYPGANVAETSGALWLRVPATVIPGLGYRALFVLAIIPALQLVRGWGLWDYKALGLRGIGPRHTNYGDASICAFDDRDGTWRYGDSLVTLLDLYVVWATRQLHLLQFGRWPGPQASFSAFERLREYCDDEWCGCDKPKGRYAHCCKERDLQGGAEGINSYWIEVLLPREIPIGILSFAKGAEPPAVSFKGGRPEFSGGILCR
jgi:hypothetical protein